MRSGARSAFAALLCLGAAPIVAQTSEYALRFFGTGVGPPGQQDRALFPVDDNVPGANSSPIDVGAGSFTIELWVRGSLADNATANAGGDVESFSYNWIDGNILLDRDIWCGSANAFGVSIAGGFVRFGTDSGDEAPFDSASTIEGNTNVLDGDWHHVAVVRDIATGTKSIYVDGVLDFAGSPGTTLTDLSYPDAGVPVTPSQCGPGQLTPYGWYLVLAAEKHDAGPAFPSFAGFVDELRIWNSARTASEIAASFDRLVAADAPGLVGSYRFEEGSGTTVASESTAAAPPGELRAGSAGNGEWVAWSVDPANTAPVGPPLRVFADGFESGDFTRWSLVSP